MLRPIDSSAPIDSQTRPTVRAVPLSSAGKRSNGEQDSSGLGEAAIVELGSSASSTTQFAQTYSRSGTPYPGLSLSIFSLEQPAPRVVDQVTATAPSSTASSSDQSAVGGVATSSKGLVVAATVSAETAAAVASAEATSAALASLASSSSAATPSATTVAATTPGATSTTGASNEASAEATAERVASAAERITLYAGPPKSEDAGSADAATATQTPVTGQTAVAAPASGTAATALADASDAASSDATTTATDQNKIIRGAGGVEYARSGQMLVSPAAIRQDPAQAIRELDQIRQAALIPPTTPTDLQLAAQATIDVQRAQLELARLRYTHTASADATQQTAKGAPAATDITA